MNRRPRRQALVTDINITPFTDVILVLLVIFMITTPLLSQSSLDVDLPQAGSSKVTNLPKALNITIMKNGAVYLEGRAANKSELKERVGGAQKISKNVAILLNIDQGSEFKNVVSVLDVLRELGIRNFNIAATAAK